MTTIKLVDEIDENIEKKMKEGLVRYEKSCGIVINYKRFYLVLNDDHNESEVIGVLNGYTAFAEIYIDDIWVDTKYLGRGFGRRLINELEQHFEDKGFNNINLCTSAFQAPEFYKKCGFKLEFVRENIKNPKLTKFFFVKFFKNDQQNQGIFNPH